MTGRLLIDGKWQTSATGASMDVINPATEEIIGSVAKGSGADIDAAVLAARGAFLSWKRISPGDRGDMLKAIGAGIASRREELARMEVRDNGKPLLEALWDIDDAAACFELYASLAREFGEIAETMVPLPDKRFVSYVRREAIGVIGLNIPWNYPLLIAAWKVAPALAVGATCVLKPSEFTPLTALELGAITLEAGLPPGVLNIVTGDGEAARALSDHLGVDKTAFAPPVPTSAANTRPAAQEIKNVSLERGGKSSIIVFDDADLDRAVEWLTSGLFWNQGQVCSSASRLIVQEGIAARLIDRLVEDAAKITIGNGLDDGVLLGPLVSNGHQDEVLHLVSHARKKGARLLCGGGRPRMLGRGYFVEPTILTDVPIDSRLWNGQNSGPVLAIRRFAEESDAVGCANQSRTGQAAIMSKDMKRCRRVAKKLNAEIVWTNCCQPTLIQTTSGGIKSSGPGRELGRWGLESYLEVKQMTSLAIGPRWGGHL